MSAAVAARRPSPIMASSTVDAAIDARPGEREAERAGHGGFGIAGIGRAVTPGVADDRAPGARAAAARLDSAAAATTSSADEPRRRQVDEIVEPRGGPAEGLVARRAMADHAVGGVDRLVDGGAGQARERHPEHRRHDAVGEILGQALDRGARHAGLVERLGIAADDLRYRRAAGGEAVAFERRRDPRRRAHAGCAGRSACSPRAPPRRCPSGSRSRSRSTTYASAADDADEDQRRATTPAIGAAHWLALAWFRLPSRRPISAPIQVTGWPIARTRRSGYPTRASISSARKVSVTEISDIGCRHRLLAWRRSRRRAAAVSRMRRNLSSICRPGSIRIPIRCRNCRPSCSPGCRSRRRWNGSRRSPRAPTGASAGPGGGGAGHADPAAAGVRAGAAGPCGGAGADLCGACARRRAGRASGRGGGRLRRPRGMPISPSSSIRTIRTGGSRARTRCSRWPTRSGGAAACWWSTRPSWMSARPA